MSFDLWAINQVSVGISGVIVTEDFSTLPQGNLQVNDGILHGTLQKTDYGATVTHLTAGGWNGGGAAKFTPCKSFDGYAAYTYNTLPTTQNTINIRSVWKFGSTILLGNTHKSSIKFLILDMLNASERPMCITKGAGLSDVSGVETESDWITFPANNGAGTYTAHSAYLTGNPVASDLNDPTFFVVTTNTLAGGVDVPYGIGDDWFSVEFELNPDAGTMSVYVTTQDGAFNDYLLCTHTGMDCTGLVQHIDVLGWFGGMREFTYIDTANNRIGWNPYVTPEYCTEGAILRFFSEGTLPAPLQPGTDYYVRNPSSTGNENENYWQLSLTADGAIIDITDVGSGGRHLITAEDGTATALGANDYMTMCDLVITEGGNHIGPPAGFVV